MNAQEYLAFTEVSRISLEKDGRIIGLMATSSTATISGLEMFQYRMEEEDS